MTDDFRSYAQQFPQAYAAATRLAHTMVQQQKKGPRIQLATVADASYHLTAGYVLCNSEHAVIQVYGVPYGSVIQGMRLYCQQIGARNSNKAYLFEAFAPNLSSLGMSGAIQCQQLAATAAATGQIAASLPFPSASFSWSFFVYIPSLTPFTLCSLQNGSSVLTLAYRANGTLSLMSQDGQGYMTASAIAPHSIHWIVVQNGISVDGTPLGVQGTTPTYPTTTNGTLSYLANNAPIGTWISKMGYGTTPLSVYAIPEEDSDLSMTNALALYTCTTDLSNSIDGSFLTLSAAASQILLGPY